MLTSTTADHRGILQPHAAAARLQLRRYPPSSDLAPFVERHWIVAWNLPDGISHAQDIVGYPCVDLVLRPGESRVFGVQRRPQRHEYVGAGRIVATKFRPGGFLPFLRSPVATITDRAVTLPVAFSRVDVPAVSRLERAVFGARSDEEQIEVIEEFLRQQRPVRDPRAEQAARAVHVAMLNRDLTSVKALCEQVAMSARRLERLFHTLVGVNPKWVLQRFRLMEAAMRASSGPVDWAAVATDLGYHDQAHFIRDFRTITGTTPRRYAQLQRPDIYAFARSRRIAD